MTKFVDDGHGGFAEGLPAAPMAMPEQTLERHSLLRGLRLLMLPRFAWSRARAR